MKLRYKGRVLPRAKVMKCLDKMLAQQGVNVTVRGYNTFLTDLGFRLGNYRRK